MSIKCKTIGNPSTHTYLTQSNVRCCRKNELSRNQSYFFRRTPYLCWKVIYTINERLPSDYLQSEPAVFQNDIVINLENWEKSMPMVEFNMGLKYNFR